MINYVWPLALVVLSNVLYHSCAKSVPEELNPLASLTVTYAIGAMVSLVFFYLLNPNADIAAEYRKMNWAPIVLGLAVAGLEVGYIYAYKAGWPISTAQIVQAAVLAVLLLFVGKLFYNEGLTWNKVAGIIACLVGLGLIRA